MPLSRSAAVVECDPPCQCKAASSLSRMRRCEAMTGIGQLWAIPAPEVVARSDPRGKPSPVGCRAPIPDLRLWRHSPRGLARGASNFDLPAQLHDPVRGNAEELGRIQGEVTQEDEQPIPPSQKN